MLFTLELQRRLETAGSNVIATASHPGISATNLMHAEGRGIRFQVEKASVALVAQTQEADALPTLFAATADIPGNTYVGPGHLWGLRGGPKIIAPARRARDEAVARRLWDVSEQLTGVTYPTALPVSRPTSLGSRFPGPIAHRTTNQKEHVT